MSTTDTRRVTRVYLVTLMPDPRTSYDPFFVTLTYSAQRAARLDPRSSAATSQAFRAAVDVERRSRHTPPNRRFFCLPGGSEFVTEWTSETPAPSRPEPLHATRRRKAGHHPASPTGNVVRGGVRVR